MTNEEWTSDKRFGLSVILVAACIAAAIIGVFAYAATLF